MSGEDRGPSKSLVDLLGPRGDLSTALAEALHAARSRTPGPHEVVGAIEGAFDAVREIRAALERAPQGDPPESVEKLAPQWRNRARDYRDQQDMMLPNRAGQAERDSLLWRARAYETCAEELQFALSAKRVPAPQGDPPAYAYAPWTCACGFRNEVSPVAWETFIRCASCGDKRPEIVGVPAPQGDPPEIPEAYFALNRILGLATPKIAWLEGQSATIREAVAPVERALRLVEQEATAARDQIQREARGVPAPQGDAAPSYTDEIVKSATALINHVGNLGDKAGRPSAEELPTALAWLDALDRCADSLAAAVIAYNLARGAASSSGSAPREQFDAIMMQVREEIRAGRTPEQELRDALAALRPLIEREDVEEEEWCAAFGKEVPILVDAAYRFLAAARGVGSPQPAPSDATWRKLLWLRHGCPMNALYGDDGEMQCSSCGIDFLRLSAAEIETHWRNASLRQLAGASPQPPREETK